MRVKEKKKDNLRGIVSNIICKTPSVYKVIKNRECCPSTKFVVKICNDKYSHGSKSSSEVKLGMANFAKLCEICDDFCQLYKLDCRIDDKMFVFRPDDEICMDCHDISEKELDNIKFLEEKSIGSVGALAIHALAFVIFHEMGHVKYDDDKMLQIEKERTADLFAMNVLYGLCDESRDVQLDRNPRLLGAFLANIWVLLVSKPKDAEIATSHPHPIERIYLFLEYFHIKDDSFLWKYAYNTIEKWANENDINMTFVKDSSLSLKDKLLDVYLRYKK